MVNVIKFFMNLIQNIIDFGALKFFLVILCSVFVIGLVIALAVFIIFKVNEYKDKKEREKGEIGIDYIIQRYARGGKKS